MTQRLKKRCCLWKLCPSTVFLSNNAQKNPAKWYLPYLALETVGSKASWQAENLPIISITEKNSLYSHMLKKQNKTKATEYQLRRGWVSHRYVLLISFLMGAWFNTEKHQNAPSPAASFIVLHHHVVGIHNFLRALSRIWFEDSLFWAD